MLYYKTIILIDMLAAVSADAAAYGNIGTVSGLSQQN